MAAINPADGTQQIELNLQLDPGLSVPVEVLDAKERPLVGVEAMGRSAIGHDYDKKFGPRLDVINLGPGESRTVMLRHEKLRLGKVVQVTSESAKVGRFSIRLDPLSTITGRVVDPDGKPVAVASVRPDLRPVGDFSLSLPQVATDADGRFRIENVPVGCDYWLVVLPPAAVGDWVATKEVAVKAGETIDVGELQPKRR
jgi:hypothetical protein